MCSYLEYSEWTVDSQLQGEKSKKNKMKFIIFSRNFRALEESLKFVGTVEETRLELLQVTELSLFWI